jgi:hypothetical protein
VLFMFLRLYLVVLVYVCGVLFLVYVHVYESCWLLGFVYLCLFVLLCCGSLYTVLTCTCTCKAVNFARKDKRELIRICDCVQDTFMLWHTTKQTYYKKLDI